MTFMLVPKIAIDWLTGEGPDHEGKWFGDTEPPIVPGKTHPRYWWRSRLREILTFVRAPENPCLEKLRPGEPFFVLLGRDKQAPNAIMTWANDRTAAEGTSTRTEQAREAARAMAEYSGIAFLPVSDGPAPNKSRSVASDQRVDANAVNGSSDHTPSLMRSAPGIHPVERLWRDVGLPEYFLGNGGTNTKLYALYDRIRSNAREETMFLDREGEMIRVGDVIRAGNGIGRELHGEWVDYTIEKAPGGYKLSYLISQKGQCLPVGYTGGYMPDVLPASDEHDVKTLVFTKKPIRVEGWEIIRS